MKSQWSVMLKVMPAVMLLACATTSTRVARSWKSPEYGGMKNILVIGIANDQAIRRGFEDDFVKQLQEHKVSAAPSYTLFPGDKIPSKDVLSTTAREKMIDTILITRVVDQKDVETYVPGNVSTYYGSYWGYYGHGLNYTYSPGYTVQNTKVILVTNLYNVASEALEWTATSDTTTVGDKVDVVRSFIPAIVRKMADDKLF